MVFASNISYLSLTRHHLLHLESFSLSGNVQTELHLDEFQLRPVRFDDQIYAFKDEHEQLQLVLIVTAFGQQIILKRRAALKGSKSDGSAKAIGVFALQS